MSLTLNEVLSLPSLSKAKIVTNIEDIDIIVNSVAVIEVPIDDFVRENELVLSTCMSCSDKKDTFTQLIKDLHDSKASVLAVSLGVHVTEIPEEIIKLAENLGLVIITIPWEVKFSIIIEEVIDGLKEKRNRINNKLESIRILITSMFLEKYNIEKVINYIEKETGIQIIILDNNNYISIASNNNIGKFADFVNEEHKIEINNLPLEIMALEMRSSNILHGHFLFNWEDITNDVEHDELKHLVQNNIVNPLLLWFDRKRDLHDLTMHYKENFIFDIINSPDREWEDLVSEGKSYGFELNKKYIAIVGKLDSNEDLSPEEINEIKKTAINIANSDNKMCLVAYLNTFFYIFLEVNGNKFEDTKSFINKFEIYSKILKPELKIIWGVGELYESGNILYYSYLDAIISLKNGLKIGNSHINTIESTSEYRLMVELINSENAISIMERIFQNLILEDNDELIKTLIEYFNNNRNVSKTSRAMFLHRQSLIYRLDRIEEITNMSLNDASDALVLELCTKMYLLKEFNQSL